MQKLKKWKKSNFDSATQPIAALSKGRDAAPRQLDVPAAIWSKGNKKARVERASFAGVLKIKI